MREGTRGTKVNSQGNWLHPEILLPRAMAGIQARLLSCSLFSFKGKYLRRVPPQEQIHTHAGEEKQLPFSVFHAKEIVHCIRREDGKLFSTTQCIVNPQMDTEVSLHEDLLAQGKRMMEKFLSSKPTGT